MKTRKTLIGITALIIAAIFTLTGCPPGDTDTELLETLNLTIAGSFASQGGGEAVFFATTATNTMLSSRSISATDFELTGLLEDGAITFRLRGNYNSETKTYTLAAAGSFLRYSISGEFNDDGAAITGNAVVQVNSNPLNPSAGTWTTFIAEIDVTATMPEIDDDPIEGIVDETEGGIPMSFRGIWRDTHDANYYAMVNAYSVVIYERDGSNWEATDTMFFTDITPINNNEVAGTTAYMSIDWDEFEKDHLNFFQDMLNAFIEKKGIQIGDFWDSYLRAQFSMTSAATTIFNKYPHLGRNSHWIVPTSVPADVYNQFQQDYTDWINGTSSNDWFNDTETAHHWDKAAIHYRDVVNPSGVAAIGAIILRDVSKPGESDPQYNNYGLCMAELDAAYTAWFASEGFVDSFIVHEMMFEEEFEQEYMATLFPQGIENTQYWVQFYSKMGLKLQSGRLYYANYAQQLTIQEYLPNSLSREGYTQISGNGKTPPVVIYPPLLPEPGFDLWVEDGNGEYWVWVTGNPTQGYMVQFYNSEGIGFENIIAPDDMRVSWTKDVSKLNLFNVPHWEEGSLRR